MSDPQASVSQLRSKRPGTAWAAFVFGVPLAAGILWLVHLGPLQGTLAQRYLQHPVEYAELLLFCCAVAVLGAKAWHYLRERAACRSEVLPPWDGKPVAVEEASKLLAGLAQLSRRLQQTYLVRRAAAVLEFLRSRGSANDLDDQLRSLADADGLAQDESYSLTRFITWAIPILGFLGTVLGITEAVAGVTPEQLENELNKVTEGLALAFDTTALGLVLTMIVMFLSFLVERAEQGILEAVDHFADRELAHRFERGGIEDQGVRGEVVALVRQNTQALLQAVEQVVRKQAEVWAGTFEPWMKQLEQVRAETEQQLNQKLTTALEAALERTLETHARRLSALEKQTADHLAALMEKPGPALAAALAPFARALTTQTEALTQLQASETQMVALQEILGRQLASAADALQGVERRVFGSELRIRLEAPAENRRTKPGLAA